MKITIVTVCFNAEATIRDTIESVLSQSYHDVEHIVVDGGSSDETMGIVRSYGDKIARVSSEPDQGLYDAMNKGIRFATGDAVGILNADDVFAGPGVLATVAEQFDDEVDAVYADLVYVSRDLSQVKRYWRSGAYAEGRWRDGWVPPHPTFYARQRVYREHGLFDLSFALAADYEILFRFLCKAKIRPRYLPEVIVKMRLGGLTNESFRNILDQNLEIFGVWEKHQVELNRARFVVGKISSRIVQRLRANCKGGAW